MAESAAVSSATAAAGAGASAGAGAGAGAASTFDPTALGLRADFRLTDFSKLKGCGCKVPRETLLGYLAGVDTNELKPNEAPGMDSSVVATKVPGVYLVSTTDFFSPLVEDPYLQGRIAACNVLSDLYAMGICEVDTVLMLLATSIDMVTAERDAVATALIRGFTDLAKAAGTNVTGGQTVMNPWPLIGGVAMRCVFLCSCVSARAHTRWHVCACSTLHEKDFIRPEGIAPGDVLVLTKPLGTQVAVNLWQWRNQPKYWSRVRQRARGTAHARTRTARRVFTLHVQVEHMTNVSKAAAAYDKAAASMARLNLTAARLMHKYGAHGATDITGFGILGHARCAACRTCARIRLPRHTLCTLSCLTAATLPSTRMPRWTSRCTRCR